MAAELGPSVDCPPGNVAEWASWLEEFERQAVDARRPHPGSRSSGRRAWRPEGLGERLVDQIKAWRSELNAIAPWVDELRACDRLDGMHARRRSKRQRAGPRSAPSC